MLRTGRSCLLPNRATSRRGMDEIKYICRGLAMDGTEID
jgi:hypothetical protein